MDIPKSMLVDAIIGRGFKSMQEADHYQQVKLADITGNQWNPEWIWNREALTKLDSALLLQIYQNDKV